MAQFWGFGSRKSEKARAAKKNKPSALKRAAARLKLQVQQPKPKKVKRDDNGNIQG